MSESVDLTVAEGVARMVLSNEAQRNALTPSMLEQLRSHVEACERRNDIRVVVLEGAGEDFSSGYALTALPAPEDLPLLDEVERTCAALEGSRLAVVARIRGHCVGAALDLACACDVRYALADAKLGITPARFGLVYSVHGTRRVARVAGAEMARWLFLSGRLVRAGDPIGRRIVGHVTDDDDALAADVDDFARAIADNAPLSIAGTKRIFAALDDDTAVSLQQELHVLRQDALRSRDCSEALAAFTARRRPAFLGR